MTNLRLRISRYTYKKNLWEHFVYLSIIYFYIRLNALSAHNGLSPDHELWINHGPALFTVIFSVLRISIKLNVTKFWLLLTSEQFNMIFYYNCKYLIILSNLFVFLFLILLQFSTATALQLILILRFGESILEWGPMCNAHLAHPVVVALRVQIFVYTSCVISKTCARGMVGQTLSLIRKTCLCRNQ
jgi:hypothetical protein